MADGAGRGHKGVGILGIDPALDGMAPDLDIGLAVTQGPVVGDIQLLLDDIHAGDQLGHRMLHLNPGVHLDKVELPVLVEEFEGSGPPVTYTSAGLGTNLADGGPLFGSDTRGRSLLHHLLMAPLHGTVPFSQINDIAVAVGQHLDFDMTGVVQIFFHIDRRIAESGVGLATGEDNGVE